MVDYEFYISSYYGDKFKDDNQFKRVADKAESVVNGYTFGRHKEVVDEELLIAVKKTICEVMDNVKEYESLGMVSSESQGSRSISYSDNSNYDEVYSEVIYRRLGDTGLTSRFYAVRW